MNLLAVLSADPVARVDKNTMSDQTLFELVVAEMAARTSFWDSDADAFRPIFEWRGLTFCTDGSVSEIKWNTFSIDPAPPQGFFLNRALQGGTIALKWLPSTIQSCAINHLALQGTVATALLPRSLKQLTLSENKFSGTFDTSGLPPNIEGIDISGNMFEGTIDIASLPHKMKTFSVNRNAFTGTLDVARFPKSLSAIWIYGNRFVENNPDATLPDGFRYDRYGFDTNPGPIDEGIIRIR